MAKSHDDLQDTVEKYFDGLDKEMDQDSDKDPTIVKLPGILLAMCDQKDESPGAKALREIAEQAKSGKYADFHKNADDAPKMTLVAKLSAASKLCSESVKALLATLIDDVQDGVYDA